MTSRIGKRVWLICGAALWLVVWGPAPAAESRHDETKEDQRIEELERKLAVLTEEFESLREGADQATSPAADEASEGTYGLGPAASKIYRKKRGVSIGRPDSSMPLAQVTVT